MSDTIKQQNQELSRLNEDYATRYGFHDPVDYFHKGAKGISHEVVEMISQMKKEPKWMADRRHEALDIFYSKPTPQWGNTKLLSEIDFDNIYYFMKP
ncbi:MAG TPA: Fe-S cluster assembly protein SufB, partial [candidate division Zixibacteria bacterium]|nr:Fe-S cluster assembly protein SufB [candidate division Zixibacteria bacterium]